MRPQPRRLIWWPLGVGKSPGSLGWPGRQSGEAGCLPQGSSEQVGAEEKGLGVKGGMSALVCKSPGRESHLVREEAERTRKNPGVPWGPCTVFTTFTTLLFETRLHAFKDCGCPPPTGPPCSSDPILAMCHSCRPPSCSEARVWDGDPPITSMNFCYVTSSQSEWLISVE